MISRFCLTFLMFTLTACGGGGGGGGGGSGGSASSGGGSSGSWISSLTTSQADVYRTTEYNRQWGLESIKAAEAYAVLAQNSKTVNGSGVKIGVVDSGVQIDHVEIASNYSASGSYDYVNSDSTPNDERGHGTHVASIAAGVKDDSGMHGVAYGATILAQKALNASGSGYSEDVISGFEDAVLAGAKVINLSLGATSPSSDIKTALINAKSSDVLSIAATGNDNLTEASYPARYASDSSLLGHVLAVGAIGYSGSIASYSNDCGDAKDYCLVAPGGSNDGNSAHAIYAAMPIGSTIDVNISYGCDHSGYCAINGTSMATPMVAGAAAVIRGAWPFLSAAQTSNILLSTATDLGTAGVDTVYGHGLLNLYAAVQAQGQNTFTYGSGVDSSGYDVRESSMTSDPIFGDAFLVNVAPQISEAVFFDDYGRDYKAFMNDRISQRSNSNMAASLTNLVFNNYHTQTIPLSFGSTHLNFQVKSYNEKAAPNQFGLKFITADKSRQDNTLTSSNGFSFSQNFGNNFASDLKAGFSVNRDELANLRGDQFNNFGFISVTNFAANPFQSFVSSSITSSPNSSTQRNFNQLFVGAKFFDKKLALNFSQQTSYDSTSITSQMGNLQNRVSDLNLVFLPNDSTKLVLSYGNLNEFNNNLLNSKALGAFESAGNAKTSYFKISATKKIVSNFSLIASFSEGSTVVNGNEQGIFRNYSDIRSRSSALGLINDKMFGGKVGVIYSQPLRVYSGKAEINVPVARDFEGNVSRYSTTVSLKPQGKERDLEVFYAKNLDWNLMSDSLVKFNLITQKQPGNVKSAGNAYLGFVNLLGKF